MQVAELRAQVHRAFDGVPLPATADEMLAAPYRTSDDAFELADVLRGRPWAEVPERELFLHREMLFALAPAAYRAYLPAYLVATLATEDPLDPHGADLREYLIDSLLVAPEASPARAETTQARLAALDTQQREAVLAVIGYLDDRWHVRRAAGVLTAWRAS